MGWITLYIEKYLENWKLLSHDPMKGKLWCVALKRILTKDNLWQRGIIILEWCFMCKRFCAGGGGLWSMMLCDLVFLEMAQNMALFEKLINIILITFLIYPFLYLKNQWTQYLSSNRVSIKESSFGNLCLFIWKTLN